MRGHRHLVHSTEAEQLRSRCWRSCFFWGLSPRLADGCPLAVSLQSLFSMWMYMCLALGVMWDMGLGHHFATRRLDGLRVWVGRTPRCISEKTDIGSTKVYVVFPSSKIFLLRWINIYYYLPCLHRVFPCHLLILSNVEILLFFKSLGPQLPDFF